MIILASLLALVGPLRAYPPIYSVKKKIALSDLASDGDASQPLSVTGLNAAGRLVGFYGTTTKVRGVATTAVQVLAWDDPTQTRLPVLAALGGNGQGLATGVSDAGWIGGVCWTRGPGTASGQWGFVWQEGTLTTFAAPDGSSIDAVVAVNNLGQAGARTTARRASSGRSCGTAAPRRTWATWAIRPTTSCGR